MALVERDAALLTFDRLLEAARAGTGHVLLVSGEAGIGKTTLLEALATRRAAAVLGELQRSRRPVVAMFEDVHRADDATLDLLKFLGRRIDRVPALLVLSWRDDEVSTAHPLRRLLGELAPSLVTRIALAPLSAHAVDQLARAAMRSASGLHALTRGNPLFVSEMLRHGAEGVPQGVQDLVLARFARLAPPAQAIVRLASTVPTRIEATLVDALLAPPAAVVEQCLDSGLLSAADGAYFFRHELARVAIESSLSAPTARALHADVLRALDTPGQAPASLARRVHHAVRAGDARGGGARARGRAPGPAARRAPGGRGALAHGARAWRTRRRRRRMAGRPRAGVPPHRPTRRRDRRASRAVRLAPRAPRPARRGHQPLRPGAGAVAAQRRGRRRQPTRHRDAGAAAARPELARAWRVEAQLRMLNRDCEAAVGWADKAIALAERLGEREILAEAVGTLGTATLFLDYEAGCAHLRRALDLALADCLHGLAANTHSNLGSGSGEVWQLREAQAHLKAAIAFSQQHEIAFFRHYSLAWLALCELHLGHWDDAR